MLFKVGNDREILDECVEPTFHTSQIFSDFLVPNFPNLSSKIWSIEEFVRG